MDVLRFDESRERESGACWPKECLTTDAVEKNQKKTREGAVTEIDA
jgi:hypothetical protein